MALFRPLSSIQESKRDDILKELGRISAILYAPDLLHFARVEAYKMHINAFFGGDVQLWAAALVWRAHYRWLRRKWLRVWIQSVNKITRTSYQWDREALTGMLHLSYKFCGLDCNSLISQQDQLVACLKVACMNFNPALTGNVLAEISDPNLSALVDPEVHPWDFLRFASYLMQKIAENIGFREIDSEEHYQSLRMRLYGNSFEDACGESESWNELTEEVNRISASMMSQEPGRISQM